MNRQEHLQKATSYLGRLAHEIKAANASGIFDINKVAEDFFIPILSTIYKCPDLHNQNRIKANFPSVDLGCNVSRTSFQITSDCSSTKIIHTLKKFREHKLNEKFDSLYVLVITEKQASYNSTALADEANKLGIVFDVKKHILDYKDISSTLSELTSTEIELIHNVLEDEFRKKDEHLKFRRHLDDFLEIARTKIQAEKISRKYIPSIFVETSAAKENMRFFSNPVFFHQKVDDALSHISFARLNDSLRQAGIDPLVQSEDNTFSEQARELSEISDWAKKKRRILNDIVNLVAPFSYDRGRVKAYEPPPKNKAGWEIFKYQIHLQSNKIEKVANRLLEEVNLTERKICLITGMAGQGKTNFICDLIENQYGLFEIPSIFIPARELNNYATNSRILNFIKNNRYAPKAESFHDLFELFDVIAAENNKPFIIAIDGINEVNALSELKYELNTFLEAAVQYRYVKVVITCRIEFFEQKFSDLLSQSFSEHIFRISDLRSAMSQHNLDRLYDSYVRHFSIQLKISTSARRFLTNDLLLLRIFCEINEKKSIGLVSSIYKGELFEEYIKRKVKDFSVENQRLVLPTLYKVVSAMIESSDYSKTSTERFDSRENEILRSLIAEDLVLRREVPDGSLFSLGKENISFTYDELRDFIIAHYMIAKSDPQPDEKVVEFFGRLRQLPVYEGVFRYSYLLARKYDRRAFLEMCERFPDFTGHYVNLLPLLPSTVQNGLDAAKVLAILRSRENDIHVSSVAKFLFHQRSAAQHLNIGLLIRHCNSLSGSELASFFKLIFTSYDDYKHDAWRYNISKLLSDYMSKNTMVQQDDIESGLISFFVQCTTYSNWSEKQLFMNWLSEKLDKVQRDRAFEQIEGCRSGAVQSVVDEIREPQ